MTKGNKHLSHFSPLGSLGGIVLPSVTAHGVFIPELVRVVIVVVVLVLAFVLHFLVITRAIIAAANTTAAQCACTTSTTWWRESWYISCILLNLATYVFVMYNQFPGWVRICSSTTGWLSCRNGPCK